MAEVTIMVLQVDLNCYKCYRKVKKVLCKFSEIRDQVYNEKQNTVTIKVVSCCPETIRQKIWRKGGKSIKSIEIKPPEKKKEEEKKAPEKKKEGEKKAPEKKEAEKQPPEKQKGQEDGKKKTGTPNTGSEQGKGSIKDRIDKLQVPKLQPKYPEPELCYGYPIPSGVCCRDCYEGRGGGPCQQLGLVCRYPCYCGCYGRPVFDSWGGSNQGYYSSRYEIYGEETPSACPVM